MFNCNPVPRNGEEGRARVREFKGMGGWHQDPGHLSRRDGGHGRRGPQERTLRIAHRAGIEETNVWDDIKFGTTSIEHWYGIPDAAIESGRQNFPATFNYNDETDRFRYAGHLWREANQDLLMKVFDGMVEAHVAWDPTLDIYEASRDLTRAQN
jgi:hypothetical protein